MQLYLPMDKQAVERLLLWKVTNTSHFKMENLLKHNLKVEIMKVSFPDLLDYFLT